MMKHNVVKFFYSEAHHFNTISLICHNYLVKKKEGSD